MGKKGEDEWIREEEWMSGGGVDKRSVYEGKNGGNGTGISCRCEMEIPHFVGLRAPDAYEDEGYVLFIYYRVVGRRRRGPEIKKICPQPGHALVLSITV